MGRESASSEKPSWGQSTRKRLVSATALQEPGALENQEGSAQRCLWDVLSLPAPATCGSPFPSPLIRLQLPALLGIRVALSRDFPDHLGRSIPAFPRVARCRRGNTRHLLESALSASIAALLCRAKTQAPKILRISRVIAFPQLP